MILRIFSSRARKHFGTAALGCPSIEARPLPAAANGDVRATSLRSSAAARLDGRGARNYKRVFAHEALSPGLAGERCELLQVLGIVDVEGDSRQVQHDTRLAGGFRW